jgi:hypothetical protein
MLDDDIEFGGEAGIAANPSAEGFGTAARDHENPSAEGYPMSSRREPSAEVRETAAVYLIRRGATCAA